MDSSVLQADARIAVLYATLRSRPNSLSAPCRRRSNSRRTALSVLTAYRTQPNPAWTGPRLKVRFSLVDHALQSPHVMTDQALEASRPSWPVDPRYDASTGRNRLYPLYE